MRYGLGALIALGLSVGPEVAQTGDVLRVQVPGEIQCAAGKATVVEVQMSVRAGFHVQANPVRNRFLKPIVLDVPTTQTVVTGPPRYPESKIMRLDGSDEDLVIYDGTFSIRLPLAVASDAPVGPVTLRGVLRYQACDDRHCLFPAEVPIELRLTIRADTTPASARM